MSKENGKDVNDHNCKRDSNDPTNAIYLLTHGRGRDPEEAHDLDPCGE
jgi:hypothetical protein